jgi:hypothetical protein
MRYLLALLLAQPSTLNLNQNPIMSRQNGGRLSTTRQFAIDCYGGTACSVDGGVLRIWTADAGASSPGGSSDYDGGYNVIEDEGAPLTKRTTVDFTGAGVTCTDTGAKTSCSIPGGGGGGTSPYVLSFGGF